MPDPIGFTKTEHPSVKELPQEGGERRETREALPQKGGTPQTLAPAPMIPKDTIAGGGSTRLLPTRQEVETIMSEGLEDTYRTLSPKLQVRFKTEGERVATRIVELMRAARATADRVLGLVRGWLAMIPGINRFFLEQEAKIKTDAVLHLTEPPDSP